MVNETDSLIKAQEIPEVMGILSEKPMIKEEEKSSENQLIPFVSNHIQEDDGKKATEDIRGIFIIL